MSTEMAWSDLLKALDPDPAQAAERLQTLITKLMRLFEWRGCRDSDEAAYEVVDRVADKVSQGLELTTSLERYALGFVNPIFHEWLRRQQREKGMLEDLPRQPGTETLSGEDERWLGCLDRCLESLLAGEEQDLLLLFHAHQGRERIQARRRLAEERGKTVNALRIEAHRLRKKLRPCVERCAMSQGQGDAEESHGKKKG